MDPGRVQGADARPGVVARARRGAHGRVHLVPLQVPPVLADVGVADHVVGVGGQGFLGPEPGQQVVVELLALVAARRRRIVVVRIRVSRWWL